MPLLSRNTSALNASIDSVLLWWHLSQHFFAICLAFVTWLPLILAFVFGIGIMYSEICRDISDSLASLSPAMQAFLFLFTFKFLKVIVHTISYNVYRPMQLRRPATLTSRDCTVIIPTVGDMDEEFVRCVETILACKPAKIIVCTVGEEKLQLATQVCASMDSKNIETMAIDRPNKRRQVSHATEKVKTAITVLADDHVFWPKTFLESAIIPFEDAHVGLVGTVKRVRRESSGLSFADFLNFVATIYLERHNFECTASYAIDGGVFVISGRTALLRTSIIQSLAFRLGFLNEMWLGSGPMNVDDDNFTCRWMVTYGHKVVFHNTPEALMETSLGTTGGWTKFRGQLDRWARTTWRSNSTTLFADRTVWRSQPWCVYAVYFSAFVNLALLYDPALALTLYLSPFGSRTAMWWLGGALFISKLIKPFPHYMRNPDDLKYLPFQILFGYYHSYIKLNALWTCRNVAWGTRKGVDEPAVPPEKAAAVI